MAEDRTLGQVLHAARIAHNPPAERPRGVPPWEERAGWQRDLDEKMAAAVEAAVRGMVAGEIRERARTLWPPGFQRRLLEAAADAVAGETEERGVTAGTQCDNCRAFGPPHPPGWFCVAQQPGEDDRPTSLAAALFGRPSEPLTFCSIRCLSEWAYVRNAAAEAAAGTEPG